MRTVLEDMTIIERPNDDRTSSGRQLAAAIVAGGVREASLFVAGDFQLLFSFGSHLDKFSVTISERD